MSEVVNAGMATTAPLTTPPAPAAAPVAAPATPSPGDWMTGFSPELKGFVESKNFKDPATVAESYRNLEKLLGGPREKLFRIPDSESDAKAWGDIYDKLGRPKDAKEYDIKVPEGMGDQKFADWARGKFHELGFTKKQAETLTAGWNEYIGKASAEQTAAMESKTNQEVTALQSEWGAAHDQNLKIAKAAASEFGFDGAMIDALESAMGYQKTIKLLHSLGQKVGSDKFVGPDSGKGGGFGVMSPEQATIELQRLQSDKAFVQKYIAGDADARARMENLHRMKMGG